MPVSMRKKRKRKLKIKERKRVAMVTTSTLKEKLCGSEYDAALARIYKPEDIAAQKQRYIRVAEAFEDLFGSGRQVGVFSAPGRTAWLSRYTEPSGALTV